MKLTPIAILLALSSSANAGVMCEQPCNPVRCFQSIECPCECHKPDDGDCCCGGAGGSGSTLGGGTGGGSTLGGGTGGGFAAMGFTPTAIAIGGLSAIVGGNHGGTSGYPVLTPGLPDSPGGGGETPGQPIQPGTPGDGGGPGQPDLPGGGNVPEPASSLMFVAMVMVCFWMRWRSRFIDRRIVKRGGHRRRWTPVEFLQTKESK